VITGLKRIFAGRGARALTLGSDEIRPVVGGLGISIMTTPEGPDERARAARKAKIGGASCFARSGKPYLQGLPAEAGRAQLGKFLGEGRIDVTYRTQKPISSAGQG